MLSKSQFIRGRQCHKSLWLYNHRRELRSVPSDSQQAVFDSGTDVGILAQQLFPGGIEVPYAGLSFDEQVTQTRQAMAAGVATIYEATFIHDNLFVKVDILHRGTDGWELYEVKSSTGCNEVYLDDIAVQWRTLLGCGVELQRAALVHINNQYVRQGEINVHGLFTVFDVTTKVMARQDAIATEVARQQLLVAGDAPAIDIGPHCGDPYPCDFKAHCWAHISSPSVFDLRDHGKPDAFALYRQGIIKLEDIDISALGWRQQLQVNGTLHQQNRVDPSAVTPFLEELWYPLCHLDFETTYMTPVPLYEGIRPYQQVPFQFSLHIEDAPGAEIRHIEFLADAECDPQEAFMQALVTALPEKACILTWNQSFESARLKELAVRLPHWQGAIATILPNIRDLMALFRNKSIYHWQFNGSYSIKSVLPALVPELSYNDMEVSNGEEAAQSWLRLRSGVTGEEREQLRNALLSYCHLDTLAMVKILEWIRENNSNTARDRRAEPFTCQS